MPYHRRHELLGDFAAVDISYDYFHNVLECLGTQLGYTLDGGALPGQDFASMAFIAPLGVSAMIDTDNREWLDAIWIATVEADPIDHYEDSIKLLSMIVTSGNWWPPEPPSPRPACDQRVPQPPRHLRLGLPQKLPLPPPKASATGPASEASTGAAAAAQLTPRAAASASGADAATASGADATSPAAADAAAAAAAVGAAAAAAAAQLTLRKREGSLSVPIREASCKKVNLFQR